MPDFLRESMQQYLDQLASAEPTPGGGSAAALTGAMSAALLCMSARFTVGREKYAAFQPQAGLVLEEAEKLRAVLQQLTEEDALAYARYRTAAAMPKSSEEEKTARRTALQSATRASAEVPMAIAHHGHRLLELAEMLADHCNPYLVSDVVVATHFALAAFRSAVVNVQMNLAVLEDTAFISETTLALSAMTSTAPQLARLALEKGFRVMNLPAEDI